MTKDKLEVTLVGLLKEQGKWISVAESFTGGGVGRRIVSVSGASSVYFEGINAYNERAKMKRLGVLESTLKSHGAVSKETAYEMALGLLNTGNCDFAIATTGLAGPNSDESGLPVGHCCIAIGEKDKIEVHEYHLNGTREEITEQGIDCALDIAIKYLKK